MAKSLRKARRVRFLATLAIVGGTAFVATRSGLAQREDPGRAPTPPAAARQFLNQYCVGCHNEKLKTGGLMLDKLDPEAVGPQAETWEKVVRKLRAGLMPPAGLKRPDKAVMNDFLTGLESRLDSAAFSRPDPGTPALHRLNRVEYANAIRDLISVPVDTASLLPPDDASDGFDNIADVLGVSPALMERYLAAAAKISRAAIGDPAIAPVTSTYRVRGDLTQTTHIEGLPLGTRGGISFEHFFPLDAEYVFKMALLRTSVGAIFGQSADKERMELTVDGNRVRLLDLSGNNRPPAPPEGGTYEGNAGRLPVANGLVPKAAVPQPVASPVEKPSQSEAAAPQPEVPGGRGGGPPAPGRGGGGPQLEAKVTLKAGPHTIGVAFLNRSTALVDDLWQESRKSTGDVATGQQVGYTTVPHLASVAITGPFNAAGPGETPSRRRIFVCQPSGTQDEVPCARKIISSVVRRAYRRPVTDADLDTLLGFYQTGRNKGSFAAGIEGALRRILADPQFIFRFEAEPQDVKPGAAYPIGDLELASRMSFFLWSSIPDDELLDLAVQGKLHQPEVLLHQTKRMLASPNSASLADNFAGQWLGLRDLKNASPFSREFDDNLRQSMRTETELLFESILREDRGVLDLLTANYAFIDERLARHYGIPHVYGSQFRRVDLSGTNRRGILGEGSILTITSVPNRTSPVQRGKWILENILGTPAPLPPPNIPPLPESGQEQESSSVRQRMEMHRANPVCAACHKIMDPIGFSLENFDNTGKWREKDGNSPINSGSQLVDGTPVQGIEDLRNSLVSSYSTQFVRTFSGKLMTYALGRTLGPQDMPEVRRIVRESEPDGNRLSAIVAGIVSSPQFRLRTNKVVEPQIGNSGAVSAAR